MQLKLLLLCSISAFRQAAVGWRGDLEPSDKAAEIPDDETASVSVPRVSHLGKKCTDHCGRTENCKTNYCGHHGMCCQKGQGKYTACGGLLGGDAHHECVATPMLCQGMISGGCINSKEITAEWTYAANDASSEAECSSRCNERMGCVSFTWLLRGGCLLWSGDCQAAGRRRAGVPANQEDDVLTWDADHARTYNECRPPVKQTPICSSEEGSCQFGLVQPPPLDNAVFTAFAACTGNPYPIPIKNVTSREMCRDRCKGYEGCHFFSYRVLPDAADGAFNPAKCLLFNEAYCNARHRLNIPRSNCDAHKKWRATYGITEVWCLNHTGAPCAGPPIQHTSSDSCYTFIGHGWCKSGESTDAIGFGDSKNPQLTWTAIPPLHCSTDTPRCYSEHCNGLCSQTDACFGAMVHVRLEPDGSNTYLCGLMLPFLHAATKTTVQMVEGLTTTTTTTVDIAGFVQDSDKWCYKRIQPHSASFVEIDPSPSLRVQTGS